MERGTGERTTLKIRNMIVRTAVTTTLYLTALTAAQAQEQTSDKEFSLEEVVVTSSRLAPGDYQSFAPARVTPDEISARRAASDDTAQLLTGIPGVSVMTGGPVSGLPSIRGVGDDRVRVTVNGVSTTSACANHMNPPLSYLDSAAVGRAGVMAGITPVSMGGDSIGGSILVDSPAPRFATDQEKIHTDGRLSSFFHSNGTGYGGSLATSVANRKVSLGYSGAWSRSGDYRDGNGAKITSTYYETTNHTLTFAARGDGNLVTVEAGLQQIPYQGFVNQQMDMTGNRSYSLNLNYRRDATWGSLDTRVYWRTVRHEMNIGKDKSDFPNPMNMPMETRGSDAGYVLKAELPLFSRHTVRAGSEFNRFELDDWWPPVTGAGPLMSPDSFKSINDGHRDRLAFFAELESDWNSSWTTLVGVRSDTVWSDTGTVRGYSSRYAADANKFNSRDRSRSDINFDLTLLARYEPGSTSRYEIGYARKSRSPNLYERYAWSTNMMASGMINWFGDGNYYVGNPDLKPEVAHLVNISAGWHDDANNRWEIRFAPYFTYVEDYIDVDLIKRVNYGGNSFSQLRFANHDAIIYGVDVNWFAGLWDGQSIGRGRLSGTLGWVRGSRLDSGDNLYRMMPLNARIVLEETVREKWKSAVEMYIVDGKTEVDPLRNEQKTPGYVLINLRSSYQWRNLDIETGITNLLDKHYYLPQGGVNFDNFMSGNWNTKLLPLSGQGRSFYAGLTVRF